MGWTWFRQVLHSRGSSLRKGLLQEPLQLRRYYTELLHDIWRYKLGKSRTPRWLHIVRLCGTNPRGSTGGSREVLRAEGSGKLLQSQPSVSDCVTWECNKHYLHDHNCIDCYSCIWWQYGFLLLTPLGLLHPRIDELQAQGTDFSVWEHHCSANG